MAEVEEQFENFEEQPAAEEPETYEEEVDNELVYGTTAELPEIKLFGRWSCDDVNVSDMSLAVSVPKAISTCFVSSKNVYSNNIFYSHLRIRITLQLKKSTLVIYHIQLVVMLPNDSVKHNAQSLND